MAFQKEMPRPKVIQKCLTLNAGISRKAVSLSRANHVLFCCVSKIHSAEHWSNFLFIHESLG